MIAAGRRLRHDWEYEASGSKEHRRPFERAAPELDQQFHSAFMPEDREGHHHSIQELTSLFVSGLENARRLNGNVDARNVIAAVSEGLNRHDRAQRKFDLGNDDYVNERARDLARVADLSETRIGPPAAQNRQLLRLHSPRDATMPWRGEPGGKLLLCTAIIKIDTPDGLLNARHRVIGMNFGFGEFSFLLQIQFTMGGNRTGARRASTEKSSNLGFGTAACALVAAAILLCAIAVSPEKQPRRLGIALVEPKHMFEPPHDPHISSPIFLMSTWPREQKPFEAERAQTAIDGLAHVATRATTNIRSQPTNRASIVRVVPGRLVLTVHARSDDWIEVGGAEAWGWVPSHMVEPFELKG
ncbi:MAG: SH3 domain-containing protein [Hyphomicrobiales bacterium]|nr:SH3 domain-containing protein [Hyphomicrobiales bacterium]